MTALFHRFQNELMLAGPAMPTGGRESQLPSRLQQPFGISTAPATQPISRQALRPNRPGARIALDITMPVLVVDDEKTMLDLTRRLLARLGLENA
jgi:hypothetical protein